jgi:molybdopterin-guanine dinucleotide biosynthesis protein B
MSKVFGIVGWSGSGKTELITRLIEYFYKKKILVSSIKHTHHKFNIDKKGKDSFKHIQSGSNEVILYNENKWALVSKLQNKRVDIEEMITKFDRKTQLILIEGLKYSKFPKIEVFRASLNKSFLFEDDNCIKGVVSDKEFENLELPRFNFKDTEKIGKFISNYLKL